MLYYQAIDPATLEVLKRLLQIPELSSLRLVGGTSLALQLGHRKSVDIDLFGILEADDFALSNSLRTFDSIEIIQRSENIRIYLIDGIKVDIVNYPYPWLESIKQEDGIRLAQMRDIAAMKLSAITGRGTKKDFVDISFLLRTFSLKQMIEFYLQKYFDGSEFLVLKSLSYFEDADGDLDPVMLKKMNWQETKRLITNHLEDYV
jgi:hypothetical protein